MDETGLHAYFRSSGAEVAEEINRHREEAAKRAEEGGAPPFFVEAIRGEPEDIDVFAEARANELMEAVRRTTPASDFALCEIDARLVYPVEMLLTPTQMVLPGNNVIRGGAVIGGEVAVQIG